jgi:hypothetical protein
MDAAVVSAGLLTAEPALLGSLLDETFAELLSSLDLEANV